MTREEVIRVPALLAACLALAAGVAAEPPKAPVKAGKGVEKKERPGRGERHRDPRSQPPQIARALPDLDTGTILIQGWYLGELLPRVTLAGTELTVYDFGPRQVLAGLPEDAPAGSHQLRLTQGWPPWRSDVFEVTLGAVGPQGRAGDEGPTGPEGPVGPAGLQGAKGDPGEPGEPGAPGRDGATWTSGPESPDPSTGASGDFHLDESTGDVYRRDESAWTAVANLAGPEGAPGIQGQKGDPGDKGDEGDAGDPGLPGADGAPGPQGLQGPPGSPGPPGPPGADAGEPASPPTDPWNLTAQSGLSVTGWLRRPEGPLLAVAIVEVADPARPRQPGQILAPGPLVFERRLSADAQLHAWHELARVNPAAALLAVTLAPVSAAGGPPAFSLVLQDTLPIEWGIHLYPDGTFTERLVLSPASVTPQF